MSSANFDTLKLSETLREGGLPEVQAKAVSQALQETLSEFATKRDLRDAVEELRSGFRFEMREFRGEVRSELQLFRSEIESYLQSLRSEVESHLQSFRSEIGSDQQSFRSEVKADMQKMRSEIDLGFESMRAEMRQIEPRMTIRLGGIVVVALGAFTALSKWIA